ncbi:MAG: WD40/YVTN/BNR-like repeat-containing protein [Lautropia sp.]
MTVPNASASIHVYAGTAGHSAWFSEDLGRTWVHPNSHSGLYLEARVWSFASHPDTPGHCLAGTDMGLYRWDESTARWTSIASPMQDVWALAADPADPKRLLAGTRPAALYESTDDGLTWTRLATPGLTEWSDVNAGPTRVTQILFDPVDRDTVWSTIEIGGVYRSRDRGRRWERLDEGLVSADLHGVAVVPAAGGGKHVYVTTNRGLHRSDDDGRTWQLQTLDSPWQYTRAIAARPDDPSIVFLGNGNGPPGNDGRLMRSRDRGLAWSPVRLPGDLNSTVWCIAMDPSDPMLVFVATNLGQVFRSTDGGETWSRLPHEFGEIRALHWRALPTGARKAEHSITRPMVKVPW